MKKVVCVFLILLTASVSVAQTWNLSQNFFTGKIGLSDDSNKVLLPAEYDQILEIDNNYALIKLNNKFGAIDRSGQFIIPCDFDSIALLYCQKDISNVFRIGNYRGLWHPELKYLIAEKNNKWGILDSSLKEILPFIYERFGISLNDVIMAKKSGKWGMISLKDKKEIFPFLFDSIYTPVFFDKIKNCYVVCVLKDGINLIRNSSGETYQIPENDDSEFRLIHPEYGYFLSENGTDINLYFYKTSKTIKTDYMEAYCFTLWDNSYAFTSNNSLGPVIVNPDGKELFRSKYPTIDNIGEKFLVGKRFFFDDFSIYEKTQDKVEKKYDLLKTEYFELYELVNSIPAYLIVINKGKYGLIKRTEDSILEVLPCLYDNLEYLNDFYNPQDITIRAKLKGQTGIVKIVNNEVKWIIKEEFQEIEVYDYPWFYVMKNGKYGLLDVKYNIFIPCFFNTREEATNYLIMFGKCINPNNKYFFHDQAIYERNNLDFIRKYVLIPHKIQSFENVICYNQAFLIHRCDKMIGLIYRDNDSIQEVLPSEYESMSYVSSDALEGAIIVKKNGKFGLIDAREGKIKWTLPLEYDLIGNDDEFHVYVVKNGKYGIADLKKGLIIPCNYNTKADALAEFEKAINK